MKAAVLGAGSWGTALATVLTHNGHETVLWARHQGTVDEINVHHTNRKYFPDLTLPMNLRATTDLHLALSDASLVIFAVPSTAMADVAKLAAPLLHHDALVAHAVKGFDFPTRRRMSQVLVDAMPWTRDRVCVISGPSHAEEVIAHMPTTIVVASVTQRAAEATQDALMNQYLRVYTNPDVIGAEIGGSLKNIIALGVGIADGLGVGDNAKAALMTRGLAEIARLGMKLGASVLTFAGLSGVGDLIVTCTSTHSRNFRAGRLLASGMTLDEVMAQVNMAIEGVPTTRTAMALATENGIHMPITEALYGVLFEGQGPKEAVDELMGRAKSHEIEEVAKEHLVQGWQK